MWKVLTITGLLLTGCGPDETISGYADPAAVYRLQTMDGAKIGARVTIQFPQEGQIIGDAPCNRYSGAQTAPYPWFAVETLTVGRATCPERDIETAYLRAVAQMSFAEVAGDVLILSNENDGELVFQAE